MNFRSLLSSPAPARRPRYIVCVDMDGVVAEWRKTATEKDLWKMGYWISLLPVYEIIWEILIICLDPDCDVYIATAVIETLLAKIEKWLWCNRYMPFIDRRHRIFIRNGSSKAEAVTKYLGIPLSDRIVLLDDYSKNLHDWREKGGRCIKIMNGLNGTKGTWRGEKFSPRSGHRLLDLIKKGGKK